MRFILNLARRELRSSWRRLLFFFICISIGVSSIVTLRSMTQNLNQALSGEARALLTADVQVDSNRPWSDETLAVLNRVSQSPLVTGRVETIESATMVRPADPANERALMIELKGIERGFPLYGAFRLADGSLFDYGKLENNGAIVAAALLDRLSVATGDRIRIGTLDFEIRGVLDEEPGGTGGFRLGPRVFIERSAVDNAGLTGFGSRARRRILLSSPAGSMPELVRQLRADLKNNLVNVRSYRDSQENLNESLSRAEDYLSLTGLVILVLGGIGISNVTRVFIEQKKRSIAVLKCIGGTGGRVVSAYLTQVIVLGLAGSAVGIIIARVLLYSIGVYFGDSLPDNLSYSLQWRAIAQGLGIGVLITILFSAVPLLRIRHIKPNVLLREDESTTAKRFDVPRLVTALAVILGLVLLVSWQAGSIKVGSFFLVGLAVTAGLLQLAAILLVWLVRQARHIRSFALRQAISSLYRPGNQTRVIVMVVGLGAFLVIATQSVQVNLVNELDFGRQGRVPNFFFIDVQPDQRDGVQQIVKRETGEDLVLVPTIRARIVEINSTDVDLEQGEMRRDRGRLGREYVVTYRPNLEPNETVIAGTFWDSPSPDAEVSIEESMRGMRGLDVGSTITFDVQGRRITATVSNVRRVDWRNARTGFMVLFRPGTLETAPQSFVGALNGPSGELEKSRFQRAVLDKYPNVSIIDVSSIVASVKRIVNNVTLGVTFLGGFVFLSGALILIGSIAMTKFQRVYESAVLKTLGANRKSLIIILFVEYGLLGLVAGIIGSLAAIALSYSLSHWVLDIPWSFMPGLTIGGIAATMALVVVVGMVSTVDVLNKKPLAILRSN